MKVDVVKTEEGYIHIVRSVLEDLKLPLFKSECEAMEFSAKLKNIFVNENLRSFLSDDFFLDAMKTVYVIQELNCDEYIVEKENYTCGTINYFEVKNNHKTRSILKKIISNFDLYMVYCKNDEQCLQDLITFDLTPLIKIHESIFGCEIVFDKDSDQYWLES